MTVHIMVDSRRGGMPERGTFGIALVAALVLEIGAVAALAFMPASPPPEAPEVAPVHIHAAAVTPPPEPPPPEPPPPEPPPPEPPPPEPPPPQAPPPEPPPPEPAPPVPEPPPPPPKAPPRQVTPPRHAPEPRPAAPAAPAVEAPPPTPTAPAVSAATEASVTAIYAAALRARVQANLIVPSAVRLLGASGISRVAIRLAPSGTLLGVTLTGPSGNEDIDEAALKSVRGSQFPAFSPEMPQHVMTFTLTVRITP